MKLRVTLGILSMIACVITSYLCRYSGGKEFFMQYFRNGVTGTALFTVLFAAQGVVVFVAFLISKGPAFLPGVLTLIATLITVAIYHHSNEMVDNSDAMELRRALGRIFMAPMVVQFYVIPLFAVSWIVQYLFGKRQGTMKQK